MRLKKKSTAVHKVYKVCERTNYANFIFKFRNGQLYFAQYIYGNNKKTKKKEYTLCVSIFQCGTRKLRKIRRTWSELKDKTRRTNQNQFHADFCR
jgi:hypothetical protein